MAEEKTHAEEDEKHGLRRGTSLYCKLSIQEVQEALNYQAKKAAQKLSCTETNCVILPNAMMV